MRQRSVIIKQYSVYKCIETNNMQLKWTRRKTDTNLMFEKRILSRDSSFDILVFCLAVKNCIVKNENYIVFPEYVNSNPVTRYSEILTILHYVFF